MSKKNDDMLQCIQRMEEKIKNLSRENVELVSNHLWHHAIRTHCTQLLWGEGACEALTLNTDISESQQQDGISVKFSQYSWIFVF